MIKQLSLKPIARLASIGKKRLLPTGEYSDLGFKYRVTACKNIVYKVTATPFFMGCLMENLMTCIWTIYLVFWIRRWKWLTSSPGFSALCSNFAPDCISHAGKALNLQVFCPFRMLSIVLRNRNFCSCRMHLYDTAELCWVSCVWVDEEEKVSQKVTPECERAKAKASREQVQLNRTLFLYSPVCLPAKIQNTLLERSINDSCIGNNLIPIDFFIEFWDLSMKIFLLRGLDVI